jgi:5-methylcytosine-specific restriction enzyme subunit McrC
VNRLVLGEYETLDEAALPLDEAVALAATGAVEVLRTASPGHWTVRAGKHVGAVRVGETELQIHPKVPVERLLYLLGYARDPRGWRDDEVLLAGVDELVPAMAVSFVALAHRALQQGVLQGYEEREESLLLLRGRLREGEQVRRRMGLALPLEVRYDEFTVDIAENRILLGAARRLLALPGVPAAARGSLVHLTAQLADVRAPVAGERFPVVGATRLNARYRPAIRLAELVLRGRSVELLAGGVRASGFLFDMNRVFEDWLTAALTAALSAHGGTVRPQLRTWLDEAGRIPVRPDLTWWSQGRCTAVVDAKYKALRLADAPNADLYQMLTYCKVMELPHGHLVYAAGDEQPRTHAIRNSGVEVHVHTIDLTGSVTTLRAQVDGLAEQISRRPA